MIQQFHFWVFIQRKSNINLKNFCTSMYIAASFPVAKIQKQPKYLLIDNG